MWGSEEGDILFLQLAVMFKMKKKNEREKIIEYQNFFENDKKKEHSTI